MVDIWKLVSAIAVAFGLIGIFLAFSGSPEPKLKTATSGPYTAAEDSPAEITFYAENTRDSEQSYLVEVGAGDRRFLDVADSDRKTTLDLGPAESNGETREVSVNLHSTLNGSVDTFVTAKLFEQNEGQSELIRTKRIDVTAE
ncbi:hypothetical protein [Halovenus sp. HT40]|uniref:hypothetical protein n=1 Tax=Halovenus sp. HT40 TaxID=3126691 RepID=UPI00300F1641